MTLLLQRRVRLPEPEPKNIGPFPTFMLTLPDLGPNNQCLRVFGQALIGLGGGFTSWHAHGVWNDNGDFIWEDVLVFVVATEHEHVLRGIYRACLDELGEKEGFFVAIGSHTIV